MKPQDSEVILNREKEVLPALKPVKNRALCNLSLPVEKDAQNPSQSLQSVKSANSAPSTINPTPRPQ